eukprot:Sspe_Gene.114501::Locus_100127_Transcript_1_3_Confidence_0.500_Length_377::g.114501::m.114501
MVVRGRTPTKGSEVNKKKVEVQELPPLTPTSHLPLTCQPGKLTEGTINILHVRALLADPTHTTEPWTALPSLSCPAFFICYYGGRWTVPPLSHTPSTPIPTLLNHSRG